MRAARPQAAACQLRSTNFEIPIRRSSIRLASSVLSCRSTTLIVVCRRPPLKRWKRSGCSDLWEKTAFVVGAARGIGRLGCCAIGLRGGARKPKPAGRRVVWWDKAAVMGDGVQCGCIAGSFLNRFLRKSCTARMRGEN